MTTCGKAERGACAVFTLADSTEGPTCYVSLSLSLLSKVLLKTTPIVQRNGPEPLMKRPHLIMSHVVLDIIAASTFGLGDW